MTTSDTAEAIDRIFTAQQAHRWSAKVSSTEGRQRLLQGVRDSILAHAGEVTEALYDDLRKPKVAPYHSEVQSTVAAIDDALDNLGAWSQDVDLGFSPTFSGARMRLHYEARGTALIIGTWNFPFSLLIEPLVPAIAAGNTVVLKPNEMAPATSRVVADIFKDFNEADIAVVEGGVDTSSYLLSKPFDHIFFTGSPAVGKLVMQAAAENLSSVTLELGGKCPAIVDATADLEQAARVIAEGRMLNAGQVCLATDYALVPTALRDQFVDAYWQAIEKNFYEQGVFQRERSTRAVNDRHVARLQAYIDDAVSRGATLARGSRHLAVDGYVEPTVLVDVPNGCAVLQEEIFGPILPVLTFDLPEDLIEIVRGGSQPLAMYIFSNDPAFVEQIVSNTSSGGVTVNGWASHWAEKSLPFGGVGHSGSGRYHGVHGFREFSHERAVLIHENTVSEPSAASDAGKD